MSATYMSSLNTAPETNYTDTETHTYSGRKF